MDSIVARKLYDSLIRNDPDNYDWFSDAVAISSNQGMPLDRVIWEAVRQILRHFDVPLAPPAS